MSQNAMTRHSTTTARDMDAAFPAAVAPSERPTRRSTPAALGERIHQLASTTAPSATLLVRAFVGAVFLLEGILKFVNPQELGVGRFIKIGIPFPSFFAPFDGVFEIGCGVLLMVGLMTRLGAIPMIINMIVALTSTKIPLLFQQGFWKAAHEARLDVSMLLGSVFLLLVGAGPLSLDSFFLARSRRSRTLNKTILAILGTALVITGAPGRLMAGEAPLPEQTIEVRLTEYRIEMPLHLVAGRTRFKVTNAGEEFHRFEIEGKGIEKEVASGVDAGETKTLVLDLAPGSYEVYCPVRGHKKAGMSLHVQVG